MNCLKCGAKTAVLDSRPFAGTRYRKRKCIKCNNIFWTVEDEADPEEVRELIAYQKAVHRRKQYER